MLHSLFGNTVPLIELVIRAGSVFIFVLLLLRISGKREMGQLSATELVAILLISNAVQNSMNGGDNSLIGGLVLAVTLICLSWLIAVLGYRFRGFRHFISGTPTILIRHGKIIEKNLRSEHITHEEFISMLRKQGIHDVKHVAVAILESNGSLSVLRHEDFREPIDETMAQSLNKRAALEEKVIE